jgi:hypothetical protein
MRPLTHDAAARNAGLLTSERPRLRAGMQVRGFDSQGRIEPKIFCVNQSGPRLLARDVDHQVSPLSILLSPS